MQREGLRARGRIPCMPTRPKTTPSHATAQNAGRQGRRSAAGCEPYCASRKLLRKIARIIHEEDVRIVDLRDPDLETITGIHADGYRRIMMLMGDPCRYR